MGVFWLVLLPWDLGPGTLNPDQAEWMVKCTDVRTHVCVNNPSDLTDALKPVLTIGEIVSSFRIFI